MTELFEGNECQLKNSKSFHDLKQWLSAACASGQIAPKVFAQALDLLCQIEAAQKFGDEAAANRYVVALHQICLDMQ